MIPQRLQDFGTGRRRAHLRVNSVEHLLGEDTKQIPCEVQTVKDGTGLIWSYDEESYQYDEVVLSGKTTNSP